MSKSPTVVSSTIRAVKNNLVSGAQRRLIEELFNDHYKYRWRIYQMNFFRGLFFGLGSVLGATIVVGLLIWLLSLFTNLPVVGNFLEQSQTSIENSTSN